MANAEEKKPALVPPERILAFFDAMRVQTLAKRSAAIAELADVEAEINAADDTDPADMKATYADRRQTQRRMLVKQIALVDEVLAQSDEQLVAAPFSNKPA